MSADPPAPCDQAAFSEVAAITDLTAMSLSELPSINFPPSKTTLGISAESLADISLARGNPSNLGGPEVSEEGSTGMTANPALFSVNAGVCGDSPAALSEANASCGELAAESSREGDHSTMAMLPGQIEEHKQGQPDSNVTMLLPNNSFLHACPAPPAQQDEVSCETYCSSKDELEPGRKLSTDLTRSSSNATGASGLMSCHSMEGELYSSSSSAPASGVEVAALGTSVDTPAGQTDACLNASEAKTVSTNLSLQCTEQTAVYYVNQSASPAVFSHFLSSSPNHDQMKPPASVASAPSPTPIHDASLGSLPPVPTRPTNLVDEERKENSAPAHHVSTPDQPASATPMPSNSSSPQPVVANSHHVANVDYFGRLFFIFTFLNRLTAEQKSTLVRSMTFIYHILARFVIMCAGLPGRVSRPLAIYYQNHWCSPYIECLLHWGKHVCYVIWQNVIVPAFRRVVNFVLLVLLRGCEYFFQRDGYSEINNRQTILESYYHCFDDAAWSFMLNLLFQWLYMGFCLMLPWFITPLTIAHAILQKFRGFYDFGCGTLWPMVLNKRISNHNLSRSESIKNAIRNEFMFLIENWSSIFHPERCIRDLRTTSAWLVLNLAAAIIAWIPHVGAFAALVIQCYAIGFALMDYKFSSARCSIGQTLQISAINNATFLGIGLFVKWLSGIEGLVLQFVFGLDASYSSSLLGPVTCLFLFLVHHYELPIQDELQDYKMFRSSLDRLPRNPPHAGVWFVEGAETDELRVPAENLSGREGPWEFVTQFHYWVFFADTNKQWITREQANKKLRRFQHSRNQCETEHDGSSSSTDTTPDQKKKKPLQPLIEDPRFYLPLTHKELKKVFRAEQGSPEFSAFMQSQDEVRKTLESKKFINTIITDLFCDTLDIALVAIPPTHVPVLTIVQWIADWLLLRVIRLVPKFISILNEQRKRDQKAAEEAAETTSVESSATCCNSNVKDEAQRLNRSNSSPFDPPMKKGVPLYREPIRHISRMLRWMKNKFSEHHDTSLRKQSNPGVSPPMEEAATPTGEKSGPHSSSAPSCGPALDSDNGSSDPSFLQCFLTLICNRPVMHEFIELHQQDIEDVQSCIADYKPWIVSILNVLRSTYETVKENEYTVDLLVTTMDRWEGIAEHVNLGLQLICPAVAPAQLLAWSHLFQNAGLNYMTSFVHATASFKHFTGMRSSQIFGLMINIIKILEEYNITTNITQLLESDTAVPHADGTSASASSSESSASAASSSSSNVHNPFQGQFLIRHEGSFAEASSYYDELYQRYLDARENTSIVRHYLQAGYDANIVLPRSVQSGTAYAHHVIARQVLPTMTSCVEFTGNKLTNVGETWTRARNFVGPYLFGNYKPVQVQREESQ